MFIQKIHKKTAKKTYTTVYLTENYRENGKVKHRFLANLSALPEKYIEGLQQMLKGEKIKTVSDLNLSQGKSFGAISVVNKLMAKLGIKEALGNSEQAKLAMIQIAARIISPGSRNYTANEWSKHQALDKIFKINKFNEDDLYANLDWLCENQTKIEQKIFNHRYKSQNVKEVYLYDVTSSYFEGSENELAEYGYNRDKKKGKKQIVIGLLTDKYGYPVSVEVFKGNTGDTSTFSNQLKKLRDVFGVESVVFVGDKGMIKSAQIEEVISEEYRWNYLTSITKKQIKTLIKEDVIQLELFENKIIEITDKNNLRYILRKNPYRAKEIQDNRKSKIEYIKEFVDNKNIYLNQHPRAKENVALNKVREKIAHLKLSGFISCNIENRTLSIKLDLEKQKKDEELDGCYVIKTNVSKSKLTAKLAHDRYKDLAKVESAFRTMKTTIENIRPIYVRKEARTRAHVFIAMLAYLIIKYVTDKLKGLEYSRRFTIECLDKIAYLEYEHEGKTISIIPQKLSKEQNNILKMLNIQLK